MRHSLLLTPWLCLVSAGELGQGGLDAIKGLANVKVGGETGVNRIEPTQSRAPKLFYVTTQSSTTTLTTNSICWVSSNTALTVACGRKKRAISYDPIDDSNDGIAPSKFTKVDPAIDELAEIDVEGSKNKVDASREGKFLVYWMTTTSITTLTSYSATRTVASLICTPSNYGFAQCG